MPWRFGLHIVEDINGSTGCTIRVDEQVVSAWRAQVGTSDPRRFPVEDTLSKTIREPSENTLDILDPSFLSRRWNRNTRLRQSHSGTSNRPISLSDHNRLLQQICQIGQWRLECAQSSSSIIEGIERNTNDIDIGSGKSTLDENASKPEWEIGPVPAVCEVDKSFSCESTSFGTGDGGVEELGDGVETVDGDFADRPEKTVVNFVTNL